MRSHSLRRGLAAVVVVALGGVAGVVTGSSPAAAVPGRQVVHVGSPFDMNPLKHVIAPCPRGTVAIDGGVSIAGGSTGEVRLTTMRVRDAGSFEAVATAGVDGYRGLWRLNVFAICIPDEYRISYHRSIGDLSTQWWRSDHASCPAGKKVIGVGAHLHDSGAGAPAGVALHMLFPSVDLDFAVVQAYRVEDSYLEPWRMGVHVTCADPLPGLERVTDVGFPDIGAALCPGNKQVHGVAGGLNAGPGHLTIITMEPWGHGVLTSGAEVSDPGHPWKPVSFAICAD
jgi:hypothetical protein